jgi:hypothetical protein
MHITVSHTYNNNYSYFIEYRQRKGLICKNKMTRQCQVCSKVYNNVSNLYRHMKTAHSTETPFFKCTRCPQAFFRQGQLHRHQRNHNNCKESKVSCYFCKQWFASDYLAGHLRTHSHEKPFMCQEKECHSSFAFLCNLKRHQTIMHPKESSKSNKTTMIEIETCRNRSFPKKSRNKISRNYNNSVQSKSNFGKFT